MKLSDEAKVNIQCLLACLCLTLFGVFIIAMHVDGFNDPEQWVIDYYNAPTFAYEGGLTPEYIYWRNGIMIGVGKITIGLSFILMALIFLIKVDKK